VLVGVVEPASSGTWPSSEAIVRDVSLVTHQQRGVSSSHRMRIVKTLVLIMSVD